MHGLSLNHSLSHSSFLFSFSHLCSYRYVCPGHTGSIGDIAPQQRGAALARLGCVIALHACRHVSAMSYTHTYTCTYLRTYIHTYIHTYIYKNKHRMDAPRYVHTYTCSCITRIYMYMYTHMIVHCISPYAMLHSLFALHRILSHHITFNRTFLHVCMYT